MNVMVTVSVIVPYHEEYTPRKKLNRAKKSVMDQSVETRIIVIEDHKSKGPAWARNQGIEHADTQYIAFLDADDYWQSNKLTRQINKLKSTEAGICIEADPPVKTNKFIEQLFCGERSSLTSSILIDTEQVDTRWEESLERKEDHLFIIQTANEAGLCVCPNLITVEKHEMGMTATGNRETVLKAERKYIKLATERVPELEPHYHSRLADVWFRTGRHYHFNGEYMQATRTFLKSGRLDWSIYIIPCLVMTAIHWLSPIHPRDTEGDLLTRIAKLQTGL